MRDEPAKIRLALLALAAERKRSFCPSEVARRLAEDWRNLMPMVRAAAADLVDEAGWPAHSAGSPLIR
ncbi:MAG TPA: DUF3253 domain-containing protein [Prosthecobacter sp.]|nr:DUF3253 domain-containing protein [Prosthecobacter sp.]HRK14057.1 DUF3253 domain-containing protein [Prosthecobacter sp.]